MKRVNPFMNRENEVAKSAASVAVKQSLRSLTPFLVVVFLSMWNQASAQYRISEVITDYNGYWKSGSSAINPIKPDNSHNLLAFSYSGVRYSTGVNDAALTSHGDTYIAGDYRALPVTSIPAATTSTKIGLAEKYDGVTNGKSNPSPSNMMQTYLTDGLKGLNIGTCVANLPASSLSFSVNNVKLSAINDNIPDVVITQVADPSGTGLDRYEFTDINGARIGNSVDIVLINIPSVGNWLADFYEASTSPMTLGAGYTNTQRPMRLWTGDFGVFGINASNIAQIAYFKITLSGESDVAFVAYNSNALSVDLILPTKLTSFTAKSGSENINLHWQSASENNSDKYVVERSVDGIGFTAIGSVKAAGTSNMRRDYNFEAPLIAGNSFYRLRMVDLDGKAQYSATVSVNGSAKAETIVHAYPNPATTFTKITHATATGGDKVQLYNAQGLLVAAVKATGNETRLELSALKSGSYHAVFTANDRQKSATVIVQR
jgi:type IX secretion system substrate protein